MHILHEMFINHAIYWRVGVNLQNVDHFFAVIGKTRKNISIFRMQLNKNNFPHKRGTANSKYRKYNYVYSSTILSFVK